MIRRQMLLSAGRSERGLANFAPLTDKNVCPTGLPRFVAG
jgi:hypothetical protein